MHHETSFNVASRQAFLTITLSQILPIDYCGRFSQTYLYCGGVLDVVLNNLELVGF